ncbi:hypothetical protein GCM10010341_40070 [Streptomyces noursei]|nr:hypothetical protein GCM10010341_40070 [Streptomyces noursei]
MSDSPPIAMDVPPAAACGTSPTTALRDVPSPLIPRDETDTYEPFSSPIPHTDAELSTLLGLLLSPPVPTAPGSDGLPGAHHTRHSRRRRPSAPFTVTIGHSRDDASIAAAGACAASPPTAAPGSSTGAGSPGTLRVPHPPPHPAGPERIAESPDGSYGSGNREREPPAPSRYHRSTHPSTTGHPTAVPTHPIPWQAESKEKSGDTQTASSHLPSRHHPPTPVPVPFPTPASPPPRLPASPTIAPSPTASRQVTSP